MLFVVVVVVVTRRGDPNSKWMDGWMTKRERERAAGGGRRASIGVACVSHPTRSVLRPERTVRHGIQEENPTHQIPYSVSSVIIHHQEWKVIYVRSLLLESGQIKCRGPFYVYWKPLYSRSSSSHWNKKQNLFNVRCIVH